MIDAFSFCAVMAIGIASIVLAFKAEPWSGKP